MPALRKYPPELRERAMRLVQEARAQDAELSLNQAVIRIEQRVGVNGDTLRGWCKQAAIDAGERPGVTTTDAKKIHELEAEVRELKRANEILTVAMYRKTHPYRVKAAATKPCRVIVARLGWEARGGCRGCECGLRARFEH